MVIFVSAVSTILIVLVPSYSELSPEVHQIIDNHFRGLPFGINLNFCTLQDSLNSFRLSSLNTLMNRKVISPSMDSDEHQLTWSFPNRLLVFLDSSCQEGLMFLHKHSMKMHLDYRWLIYVDSITPVMDILEASKLEIDSDVALINENGDGLLQLSRPSRIYFKLPLALLANYSIQDVETNRKVHKAFAFWNEREYGFGNYSFDANVVFLKTKHGHITEWHLLLNKSVEPNIENIRRYMKHPVAYLMEMYNFTLNVTILKDWGLPQANGSFTGALGLVERREVEFGFSAIRLDPVRMKSMGFSFPVIDSRFHWALIQPKTFGTPAALIVPFTYGAWFAFIALVFVSIVVVRMTKLTDKCQYQNDSWGGSMVLVVGGVSQNGIDEVATKLSSKTTYFVVSLATYLLFSYYSASVLNGLILPSPDAVQNMENLLAADIELGSHDLVYMRQELLKNDSITNRVRLKKPGIKYMSMEEGWKRVRKGRFAFYGLEIDLRSAMKSQLSDDEFCQITEIQMIRGFSLSYIWTKHSPFADIMNRGLIMIRERGVLNYLKNYWLVQKPKCRVTLDFYPIKMRGMALAYGLFCVGLTLSLFIMLLELLSAQRKRSGFVWPFAP